MGWLCANAILYKGLEHLWIWVSAGVLEPILCGYQGTTILSAYYVLVPVLSLTDDVINKDVLCQDVLCLVEGTFKKIIK